MNAIGSILYYVALVVSTTALFVLCAVVFLLTLAFDRNRRAMHVMGRLWSWTIFALCPLWRVRVEGVENIPRGEAFVVAANHRSMIDIPLLYRLPLYFRWVSKSEVARIPIFGTMLKMHGDIAIRRGAASDARKLIERGTEMLGRGISVVVFPEGTRSKDGRMGRFREGAFTLALRAGVRVLPVVAEGTGSLVHGWRVRMPHGFKIAVLPPVDIAGFTPRLAAERLRGIMTGNL
jgi:1-acyl-sn-glycerol-3-phosphate acyltransferase